MDPVLDQPAAAAPSALALPGRDEPELTVHERPPLRRRVLEAAQTAFHWSGADRAYTALRRPAGAQIIMYHSIADPDRARFIEPSVRLTPAVFEDQVRFLASRRRVISLSALADLIERGDLPPSGTTVITFDDGYADNLDVAAPILARYGLPAIVFLPTGLTERGEPQPIDRLYTMFRTRTRDALTLPPDNGAPAAAVDLADESHRVRTYRLLAARLMVSSRDARDALFDDLRNQLRPAEPPRLTLDWDGVRELLRRYPLFDVGVHTRDHLDMSNCTPDVAQEQIRRCISDARDALAGESGSGGDGGGMIQHFAFPYNRSTPQARAMVKSAGLRTAVADGAGLRVEAGFDRYHLPRLDPPSSRGLFRFRTSPAYPGLSRALLRRA